MVPIIPEGREVAPTLLDRTIHLEVGNEKEEELLNIWRQPSQTTLDLPVDPDLVFHAGDNITAGCAPRKSYLPSIFRSERCRSTCELCELGCDGVLCSFYWGVMFNMTKMHTTTTVPSTVTVTGVASVRTV